MRYASIRSMDISNGDGVGISLFTQGCPFRCEGCHNPEQWDFDGGEEYNQEIKDKILDLCGKSYITRFSILGGEPLIKRNYFELTALTQKIKSDFPHIKIWLYTGDIWENLVRKMENSIYLKPLLQNVDVLVDGPFVENEKDLMLEFKGSYNQRIIDVQKSLAENEIILYK